MKHNLTTQLRTAHIKHANLYSLTPFIYEFFFKKIEKILHVNKNYSLEIGVAGWLI